MGRRQAREAAFRSLFQVDMGKSELPTALEYNIQELALGPAEAEYAAFLAAGALTHQEEADTLIRDLSADRALERLAATDRAILRLAIFELKYAPAEAPAGAVINEAVELAKMYGEESAGRFVNGVLGNVARSLPVPVGPLPDAPG